MLRTISISLVLLLISGCGSRQPTVTHNCADYEVTERDPSMLNSIVVVTGVPNHLKPECQGAQLFVSSGTSLATAAVSAAEVAGNVPMMAPAPGKDKGIFNTDDWAESMVRKLDGSVFTIQVPGLAAPVVVIYHAPRSGN